MSSELNRTVRGAMAASNEYVGPFRYRRNATVFPTIGVMVYGSGWTGTVDVQVSDPDRNVWVTLDSWTANDCKELTPPCDLDVRLFFTRTSGTAVGAIISNA